MGAVRPGQGGRHTLGSHVINGAAEIDGNPQNDGIDDEVEAGRPISHGFGNAVTQFAEPMEEDGVSKSVTALALVKDGVRPATQFGVEQPVADEDGALNAPPHFT